MRQNQKKDFFSKQKHAVFENLSGKLPPGTLAPNKFPHGLGLGFGLGLR